MPRHKMLSLCLATLPLHAVPSLAAVTDVAPSGYLVTHKAPVKATPRAVFAALGQIARWWSPQHTYSGDAGHLSMEMRAGGCFCERWNGNSIEHARVLYVARDKALRLEGSLGPLQEMAVTAIAHFALEPAGDDTALTFTYRVRGTADAALDKTAAIVDRVLGEQITRLTRFAETGAPVPLPPPAPLQDRFFSSDGVRIRFVEDGGGADAVILLHDRGSSADEQWIATGVLRALSQQQIFRVIAPDLRGHGKSEAPAPGIFGAETARDVERLMAHLGIQRAHIIGYGAGAALVAYLATRHPERFLTMTLAGGAPVRPEGAGDMRELAVTDEQLQALRIPTLALVGSRDPAMRDLVLLKQVMPQINRMVSIDDEAHATAPRSPDFMVAIQYFLRYHPGRLVK